MKVFIATEFRCTIYKNEIYLKPKAYFIYERYAKAFGEIVLCSRYEKVESYPEGYHKANFINKFIPIEGLHQVLFGQNKNKIIEGMIDSDLIVVRIPSIIGSKTADYALKIGKPYLTEIMGDAWDSYWYHSLKGKLLAPYIYAKTKSIVKNANYCIYVTEKYLQDRYPNIKSNIVASNVNITSVENRSLKSRLYKLKKFNPQKISIMTTASVNVRAKGHRFVLEAMKRLEIQGILLDYYLAGDGDKSFLKKKAEELGVANRIHFLGELTTSQIYEYLDKVDLYIQPSLQEGLPRAVIEAMSRACPCIGSNKAGIPELLGPHCLFTPSSSQAIAGSIIDFISMDKEKMVIKQFEFSKKFLSSVLNKRRSDYFAQIRRELNNSDGLD
ncbi:glycosyl transferase [Streptococcus pneumoniae]|nr:glycosyl transferase [Streptococcus pneumoniae]